ncbi:MAG: hypothetical protein ACRCXX_13925 [Cetobacterium sp.]|uniref:hypothetical protein n=1 Tax=Cetobacterium sp. TaxID=2071632 RepID=UPI003F35F07F
MSKETKKKYTVVDEFTMEEKEFDDLQKAKEEAFNVQGILYEGDKILIDYSQF